MILPLPAACGSALGPVGAGAADMMAAPPGWAKLRSRSAPCGACRRKRHGHALLAEADPLRRGRKGFRVRRRRALSPAVVSPLPDAAAIAVGPLLGQSRGGGSRDRFPGTGSSS